MSIFNGRAEDIQFKLKAGEGITISGEHDEVISSSGGDGIAKYDVLPETAEENTIAYLNGVGFYRFTTEWERITSDDLESEVDTMQSTVTSLSEDSHTHSNKAVLDKLSAVTSGVGNGLKYDGKYVGVPVASVDVSAIQADEGQLATEIVGQDLYFKTSIGWVPIANRSTFLASHSHLNKDVLDTVTSDVVSNSHSHSNKSVLDTVTSDVVNNSHSHTNKSTLDKLSDSNGKLLINGDPVDNEVGVEETYSDLDEGKIGVALFNDVQHLVYPPQPDNFDPVDVDVADEKLRIGTPVYNEDAINEAITLTSLAEFSLTCANEASISGFIAPVVADLEDNEYVDAGMELTADISIVGTCTKKYAIQLVFTNNGLQAIRPDKILEVDATHIAVPGMAFYMFEDFTGVFIGAGTFTTSKGWNIVYLTLDTSTYDVTGASVVQNADVNDYVFFVPNRDNTMQVDGGYGSILFKNVIDREQSNQDKGLYVNETTWQKCDDVQDVVPLSLTTYQSLIIRDSVWDDGIQDVPVYNTLAHGDLIKLVDASGNNYIALAEVLQNDGNPIRFIKVCRSGTIKVWLPVPQYDSNGDVYIPSGWSENRVSTTAPSFADFTPTKINYNGIDYTDNLPYEVQVGLNSLSQCINVSKAAMGHINIPEDAVVRFNGKVEPNRKYFFATEYDVSIDLPKLEFSKEDAQFVIYLNSLANIDVTLPADTLLSGEINSDLGNHKLIGCYLKGKNKWAVGCVTYEVQS